jgi:hypothetical protein
LIRLLTAAQLVSAGIVGGAMVAVEVAIVPVTNSLTDEDSVRVHQLVDRYIDPFMPIHTFFSLGLAGMLIIRRRSRAARALIGVAAGLSATVAVISASQNLPINRLVASWSPQAVPASWPELRTKWAQAHRGRTIAAMFALVASGLAAVVAEPGDNIAQGEIAP